MIRMAILAVVLLSATLAGCGGGSSGGSGGDGGGKASGAGNGAMAASFATELEKVKTCVQDDVDKKADCNIDFLQNPVTLMCSDVHTGRANQFAGADYTKFTATCDNWSKVIGSTNADKVPLLTQMITDVQAIK